jgi:hypothetical protein
MFPVDRDAIKAKMKEMRITYADIEFASTGQITEHSLKHFMNKGLKADEKTLKCLAGILECNMNEIIDRSYRLSENIPFEINKMMDNLYKRNTEDIMPVYSSKMEEFRTDADLKAMLNCTHHLFNILTQEDAFLNKNLVNRSFYRILNELKQNKAICSFRITGLPNEIFKLLHDEFIKYSSDYVPHQVCLIFLYVFIIFDAIFFEECIATTAQLMPQRKNEKADEYCNLTYRNERMRNALIDKILYKEYVFDSPVLTAMSLDDAFLHGVILMLAACEKCYLHIKEPYTDSEYINRAELSAVLKALETIFHELEIDLPELTPMNMVNTRFSRTYLELKTYFNLLNPPKKPRNKFVAGMLFEELLSRLYFC